MKTGVILVTLGGPRRPEEIPEFLQRFMGRTLSPPAQRAAVERYGRIGGFSSLVRITEAQSEALQEALGPEYLCRPAFRYSDPSIGEVLDRIAKDGAARIRVLCLSPFFASVTTGNYIAAAREHLERNPAAVPVDFLHSWHREPLFIESWAEQIRRQGLDDGAFYLFSAHSLPLRLAGEPYGGQIEETVERVAAAAGVVHQALGWQSIPPGAAEPWMTPTVEERIAAAAAAGFERIVQVPIGFTADHLETLYDIDILHRRCAEGQGLSFRRIPSLNAETSFIRALKAIVRGGGADGR